jgi:hypothetical protein
MPQPKKIWRQTINKQKMEDNTLMIIGNPITIWSGTRNSILKSGLWTTTKATLLYLYFQDWWKQLHLQAQKQIFLRDSATYIGDLVGAAHLKRRHE